MTLIAINGDYSDGNGNIVEAPSHLKNVTVSFKGQGNRLVISPKSRLANTNIDFPSHGGVCLVGKNTWDNSFKGQIRVGYKCLVSIGDNVTSTNSVYLTSAEETKIIIGDDCMFATGNQVRSDDAHAIYCVETGARLNPSKDIVIGEHVWIAYNAIILSGAEIGEGSVVGLGSIVKGKFPNNCVIAGSPARSIKKNTAWERPHVMLSEPWLRPNSSVINKNKQFWSLSVEDKAPYIGQGNIENLSIIFPSVPSIEPEVVAVLESCEIKDFSIFPSGIGFVKGLPCPEYTSSIALRLILRSEEEEIVIALAKSSDSSITKLYFEQGKYVSYDKARFCTVKNQGILVEGVPKGKYKMFLGIVYYGRHFERKLTGDDFVSVECVVGDFNIQIFKEDDNIFMFKY